MKKIKYLLGFLLVGVGLLFNNYIFAFGTLNRSDVFVEGVTLPIVSSNFQASSSYLYRFTEYSLCDRSYCSSNFSYSVGKDGVSTQYFPLGQLDNCDSTTTINNTPFNNSALSYEPYNGYFRDIFGNGHCNGYFGNMIPYGGTFPIKVSIGVGPEFGKAFVYTNDLINSDGVYSPHYGLGNGFFSTENYGTYNTDSSNSNLNYFRFFYKQNANLSSPLDGFNLSTLSGTNMTGFIAWQYFNGTTVQYQTQYNTTRQYIGDYGSQFLAGTHFGGYGMGYSSALDTAGTSFISWRDFSFQSVGSIGLESAMQLGTTNYDFLKNNKVINLGVLVLKGDSYVSRNNNASVVLLSKNPNNVKQILYEQFDCAYDDLSYIFNTEYCNSISHGYIKHDGTDEILPFTGFNDVYTVGNGNGFLDLLLGDGTYGYVSINNNQYCLNSSSKQYCFSLTTRPNDVSLKELYLQNSLSVPTSDNINGMLANRCLSDSNFAFLNPVLCNYYQNLFSTTTALGSGYYYQYSVDSNGNITMEIIDQAGLFEGHTGYVWVQDENGNWVTNCDGGRCNPNPDNVSGSEFLTGIVYYEGYPWIDSGLMLLSGYFDFEHNSTGLFFKCPFPYNNVIHIGTFDFTFGNFDLLAPINCFISAFNFGKGITAFENVGLYGVGPIMTNGSNYGFSQQHRVLFRFFDFLLCLGLFLMFRFIFKALK